MSSPSKKQNIQLSTTTVLSPSKSTSKKDKIKRRKDGWKGYLDKYRAIINNQMEMLEAVQ